MSREDIIRQIVHRDFKGMQVTEKVVRQDDAALHEAACTHFGTWEIALKYAGVKSRQDSKYTRGGVVKELRRLCRLGYDLRSEKNRARDRELYHASRKYFGSWRKALRASGINVEHIFTNKSRQFEMDQALAWVRQRSESGVSVMWSDVCLDNRFIAFALKDALKSWRKVLIAAGIEPRARGGQFWNRQRVIDCLRKRHRDGETLQRAAVYLENRSLVYAAERHCGSWRNALQAMEIESDP